MRTPLSGLLWRASLRALAQHPWQLALSLLGIALGVGVVCAVQLTQASTRQALAWAERALGSAATHRIESPGTPLAETDYVELRRRFPGLEATPVLRAEVSVDGSDGRTLTLLGVDPLALPTGGPRLGDALLPLVARPGTALLARDTAQALDRLPGAKLRIRLGSGRVVHFELLETPASGLPRNVLLVDIATAQEALARPGELDSIELRLDPATAPGVIDGLRAALPGLRVEAIEDRVAAGARLTRAFDINLTALSLLALMVGMFLIYNTETFLLLQRAPVLARLRALGVGRKELRGLLLAEAALLGLVGSVAGLLVGQATAQGLLRLVSRTVNDLYFRATITEVTQPRSLLLGMLVLGVLVTVLASIPPVTDAVRQSVRSRLGDPAPVGERLAPWRLRALSGAAALACGLLLWLPTRAVGPGFAALFCSLVAAAALLPELLAMVARHAGRLLPLDRAPAAALGVGILARQGRRQGLAAAALMVATATAMAMTVMIASFRSAVTDWLSQLLRADFYLSAPAEREGDSLAALRARLATLPGVAATSSVSRTRLLLEGAPPAATDSASRAPATTAAEVLVQVYDLPAAARQGFQLLAGEPARIWSRWESEDVALVTEPFAWHHRVGVGDRLQLRGAGSAKSFEIIGVYRDYAHERGSVALSRGVFLRQFPPVALDGLGVYAAAGVGADELRATLHAAIGNSGARLFANQEVVSESLAIFDRTFAVTEILRIIALGVAVIGIVSALLARQLEHLREYGTLRALGFSSREIGRVVLIQTLVLGLVAATCALPMAFVLAWMLVDVTNLRSFGWTMPLAVPWASLAASWLLAVGAALLAGVYPARRASTTPPALVLRDE